MDVVGYIACFCTTPGCAHKNGDDRCSNPKDSRYYVDPDKEDFKITGVDLVVAHENDYVVGACVAAVRTDRGIVLRCRIDDAYYLESMQRRFANYRKKYNDKIPSFVTFCKKVLSSFSLSHNVDTREVGHVSLVDTPGRIGTAVVYTENPSIVLKRRAANQHISDVVATHSAAYLTVSDRARYHIRNTRFSHNPKDDCYLRANRQLSTSTMSSNQEKFNEVAEVFRILKVIREGECGPPCASSTLPLRRNKRGASDEDEDGIDILDDSPRSVPKRAKRTGDDCSDPSLFLQAMRDGIKEGIAAAVSAINDSKQAASPPTGPPAPPQQCDGPEVEASRPRTTTITTIGVPDKDTLDLIVSRVMGQGAC